MIPTAIVVGLIVNRWWIIPVAGLGWALVLWADHTCRGSCSFGAVVLGSINAAVGFGIRYVIGRIWTLRNKPRS